MAAGSGQRDNYAKNTQNSWSESERKPKQNTQESSSIKPDNFQPLNKEAKTIAVLGWLTIFSCIAALAALDMNILVLANVFSFINFFILLSWARDAIRNLLYFNKGFYFSPNITVLWLFILGIIPVIKLIAQPVIIGLIVIKTVNLDEDYKENYSKGLIVCLIFWAIFNIVSFFFLFMMNLGQITENIVYYFVFSSIVSLCLFIYIITKTSRLQEEYNNPSTIEKTDAEPLGIYHVFVITLFLLGGIFIVFAIVKDVTNKRKSPLSYNAPTMATPADQRNSIQPGYVSTQSTNYNYSQPAINLSTANVPNTNTVVNSNTTTIAAAPNVSILPIQINKGMDYTVARQKLLAGGWKPEIMHRISQPYNYPVCYNYEDNPDECNYFEISGCYVTSRISYCSAFFSNGYGEYLNIKTTGIIPYAFVDSWEMRTKNYVDNNKINNHSLDNGKKTQNSLDYTLNQSGYSGNSVNTTTLNASINELNLAEAEREKQLKKKCNQVYKDAIYYNYVGSVCFGKLMSDEEIAQMFSQKFMTTAPECLALTITSDDFHQFSSAIEKSMIDLSRKKGHSKFCKEERDYFGKVKSKYNLD
ncbi:MAG: hypothetical protein ACFN9G_08545 [Cardiobacterium sp.]